MNEPTNRKVAVLNAAPELRPEQRAACLDEVCAGDAALRPQVGDLLCAHAAAEGFLEAPPIGLGEAPTMDVRELRVRRPVGSEKRHARRGS